MKTEHWIFLGVGGFILYRIYKKQGVKLSGSQFAGAWVSDTYELPAGSWEPVNPGATVWPMSSPEKNRQCYKQQVYYWSGGRYGVGRKTKQTVIICPEGSTGQIARERMKGGQPTLTASIKKGPVQITDRIRKLISQEVGNALRYLGYSDRPRRITELSYKDWDMITQYAMRRLKQDLEARKVDIPMYEIYAEMRKIGYTTPRPRAEY